MTEKPNLKACLALPWDKLRVELCEEIRAALGEKGPWKHEMRTGGNWNADLKCFGFLCHCSSCVPMISRLEPCPVPPPITDPVEVVAKRLLGVVQGLAVLSVLRSLDVGLLESPWLWMLQATSTQQIAVCLAALRKIDE